MKAEQTKSTQLNFDWLLFTLVSCLLITGLFFQLSASSIVGEKLFSDDLVFFKDHLTFLSIGLVLGVMVFRYYSPLAAQRYAMRFIVISCILLLLTLLIGFENGGVRRWIDVPGHHLFVFPIALLSVIIFLSRHFSNYEAPNKLLSIANAKIVALMLCILPLLYLQPDINGMFLVAGLTLLMTVTAKWMKFAIAFAISGTLTTFTVIIVSDYRRHMLMSIYDPWTDMLMSIYDPWTDMLDSGFQLTRSLLGLSGGGLWGNGFGDGVIKSQFPSSHEGFVLATMAEELGIIFIIAMVLLSAVVFFRCFTISNSLFTMQKRFEGFLVSAFSSCFALFCVSNVAVICGLVPTTNIPYPLLSEGGEFLVFFIVGFSIILRIDSNVRAATVIGVHNAPADKQKTTTAFAFMLPITVIVAVILSYQLLTVAVFSEELNVRYNDYATKYRVAMRSSLRDVDFYNQRGTMVDRKGRILAVNVEKTDVIIYPNLLDIHDPDFLRITNLLSLEVISTRQKVTEYPENGRRGRTLKRSVDLETARLIKKLSVRGVSVKSVSRRTYPLAEKTVSVLGLTDIDNVGLSGVELQQNEALTANKPVQLTIDSELQKMVYETLAQSVIKSGANGGSTIVVDSKTGKVLSMVNYPSVDPLERYNIAYERLKNNAIANTYEPNNLVSPFVAYAAYSTGNVELDSMLNTSGRQFTIPDTAEYSENIMRIEDVEDYGKLTLLQIATQVNSPIGSMILAKSAPRRTLFDVLQDVGFGVRTGLKLSDEPHTSIRSADDWTDKTHAQMALGRGFVATAAQILQAYIPFANGGTMHRITILESPESTFSYSTLMTPRYASEIKKSMEIEGDELDRHVVYGLSAFVPPNQGPSELYHGIFVGLAESGSNDLGIITVVNKPAEPTQAALLAKQISLSIIEKSGGILHE
jgi:cell division protein FtsW (lipid II flippase)/cell division protein FtsI/penicillin-binding protein 2